MLEQFNELDSQLEALLETEKKRSQQYADAIRSLKIAVASAKGAIIIAANDARESAMPVRE